jgi:hypothetical protein
VAAPGYWRISPDTVTLLECPLGPDACTGGAPAAQSQLARNTTTRPVNATSAANGTTKSTGGHRRLQSSDSTSGSDLTISDSDPTGCGKGYSGPLCALCENRYYFDSSKNKCFACGNQGATQLALMIAVPCAILIVVTLGVFLFLSADEEDQGNSRLRSIFNMDMILNMVTDAQEEGEMDRHGVNVHTNANINGADLGNLGGQIAGCCSSGCSSPTELFDLKSLMPKVKIMMTVFQIVSGFPAVLNLKFPAGATSVMKAFRSASSLKFICTYLYKSNRINVLTHNACLTLCKNQMQFHQLLGLFGWFSSVLHQV